MLTVNRTAQTLAALAALVIALPVPALAQSIHELESREHASEASTDEGISTSMQTPLVTRSAVLSKRVFGWVPYWISASEWRAFDWSALTAIGYFSLEVDSENGGAQSFRGWPAPELRDSAHANGVEFILTVTNFGAARNSAVLGDPVRRLNLVQTIVDALRTGGGDGVNIDFESVPGDQRDNLTAFMRELAAGVRARDADAQISMAIPSVDWSGAFDVVALAEVCDYLIMMGYDYHWRSAPTAGPVAPLAGEVWNVTRSVDTYLSLGLAPEQLLLGVPWYGYEWPTADSSRGASTLGSGRPVLYADALVAAAANGRIFDVATSTPWYRYSLDGAWFQAWYDDSLSLALKYRLVNARRLGGIGIWALGYQRDEIDVWQGIHEAFDLPMAIDREREAHDGMILRNGVLELRLARARALRVEVIDVLGRTVATVADASLPAGVHRWRFDVGDLPHGLYYVRAGEIVLALARP